MVVGLDLFTLTFDSSPIKGEGVYGWCCLVVAPHTLPLWIADQVCNDGAGHHTSTLWIPAYAGMTEGGFIVLVPTNGRIKSAMTGRAASVGFQDQDLRDYVGFVRVVVMLGG